MQIVLNFIVMVINETKIRNFKLFPQQRVKATFTKLGVNCINMMEMKPWLIGRLNMSATELKILSRW